MTTMLRACGRYPRIRLAMNLNTGKLVILLTAAALTCAQGRAARADDLVPQSPVTAPAAGPPAETATMLDSEPKATGDVTIWIRVPLDEKTVDTFSVFPYPVKPPSMKAPIKPLSDKPKLIKDLLLAAGYLNRVSLKPVYPAHGWRWQYAYETALRRSGGDLPKTILGMYSWRNKMVQYMIPEILRINQVEKSRKITYDKAMQEFRRGYTEMENEATRNGLVPADVRIGRAFRGQVSLAPGTWWVSGSRKVPGLVYYWRIPITVLAGEKSTLMLTQDNAILIQGGW